MRLPRTLAAVAGAGASALVLAAGAIYPANAATNDHVTSHAGDGWTARAPAGRAGDADHRAISLITGERVQVSRSGDRPVISVEPRPGTVQSGPGAGAESARVRTMTAGERAFVVPDAALPYLGRQLDLSLFDVTRPPGEIEITWSGDGPGNIPGVTPVSSHHGGVTARVDAPESFGAALAAGTALRGVQTIRAAGARGSRAAGVGQLTLAPGGAASPQPSADPMYPMATLIVKGVDRAGAKATAGSIAVDNVDDLRRYANMQSFSAEGEIAFSVPVGHYSIAVEIATADPSRGVPSASLIFLPEIEVTAPETVVTADARTATATIPEPVTPKPATTEQTTATFGRSCAAGYQAAISFMVTGSQPARYVTPTAPVTLGGVNFYTYFRLNGSADDQDYLYDLQFPVTGAVPATFDPKVAEEGLAVVDAVYHSDVPSQRIGCYRASVEPWELVPIRFASSTTAPRRRVEYVTADPDLGWTSAVIWNLPENNGVGVGPWSRLSPGERRTERHLVAPFAPGGETSTVGNVECTACRQGDDLVLRIAPVTDDAGRVIFTLSPSSTLTMSSAARLYVNDALMFESAEPVGKVALPGSDTALRLELDTTKSASWTTTSTRIQTTWRWRSAPRAGALPAQRVCPGGTRECVFEPLLFLSYDAGVSEGNAIEAGRAAKIKIRASHQLYDPTQAARSLTFDVSADDGANWTSTEVTVDGDGNFTATVPPLAARGFLSFRARASDADGNTIDQIITRAVQVNG